MSSVMYGKGLDKSSLTLRYSRDKMLIIRESQSSRTRPSILSLEFNNEEGLFSPDKWLQHRWQCEGVVNRISLKKKPNATARSENVAFDVDQTVLSPQRRGFSCGCRAPSPKPLDEEKSTTKARWRGNLNNSVDFKPSFQKNALEQNRNRSINNSSSVWRNNHSGSDKQWNDKTNRNRNSDEKNERMPEWLDEGPSSMTDVIELKGFEDDVREKKSKKKKGKESIPKCLNGAVNNGDELARRRQTGRQRNSRSNSTQGGSRPSSCINFGQSMENVLNEDRDSNAKNTLKGNNDLLNEISVNSSVIEQSSNVINVNTKDVKELHDRDNLHNNEHKLINTTSNNTFIKNFLNSDAEFAAYLGILDIDPTTVKKEINVTVSEPSSSRLSRFFCNNNLQTSSIHQLPSKKEKTSVIDLLNFDHQNANAPRAIVGQTSSNEFGASHSNNKSNNNNSINNNVNVLPSALKELFSNASPKLQPILNNINGGMTVEELERDLVLKSQNNLISTQPQQYQHQKIPMLPEQFFNHIQQQRLQQHQSLLAGGGGLENMKLPEFQDMDPMVVAAMMHHSAYVQQNLILRQQQQEHRISNRNLTMSSKPLNEVNGGMTVEELERSYRFNETNNLPEQQHQQQHRLVHSENVPFEIQNFFQQQQRFHQQQQSDINNLDPMATSTIMHQAAIFQQNMIAQQQKQQHEQQSQQQQSSVRHPVIQKLLSNPPIKSLNELNGGLTVQELEREIAIKVANSSRVDALFTTDSSACNNRTQQQRQPICNNGFFSPNASNFPSMFLNNIGKELTAQQQQQLMNQFLAARPYLEQQHQQNPQAALMQLAHFQKTLYLLARLLAAGNVPNPDVNQMRATLSQLMQHDPNAVSSFLSRYGNLPSNFAGQASFVPPSHLQQHRMPTNNQSHQCNTDESDPLVQNQVSVNPQRSTGVNNSNGNVMSAAAAFMPTSVMRQMTKVPSGNNSVNSCGETSARNTPKNFFNA